MMRLNNMLQTVRLLCHVCLGIVGWCNFIYLTIKPDFFINASHSLNLPWLVVPSYILLTGIGILLCSELIATPLKQYRKSLFVFVFSLVNLYAQCITYIAPSRVSCNCVSTLNRLKYINDWMHIKLGLAWFFLSSMYLFLDSLYKRGRINADPSIHCLDTNPSSKQY